MNTQEKLEAIVIGKAEIVDELSYQVEDLFDGTFLAAKMIESDIDRKELRAAQEAATESLRRLRHILQTNAFRLAYKESPEGQKEMSKR